jgi:hypothetical protein
MSPGFIDRRLACLLTLMLLVEVCAGMVVFCKFTLLRNNPKSRRSLAVAMAVAAIGTVFSVALGVGAGIIDFA